MRFPVPDASLCETAPAEHNCRFWALIGRDYPDSLIRDQLRDGARVDPPQYNLRELGGPYSGTFGSNFDGWGIAWFAGDPAAGAPAGTLELE